MRRRYRPTAGWSTQPVVACSQLIAAGGWAVGLPHSVPLIAADMATAAKSYGSSTKWHSKAVQESLYTAPLVGPLRQYARTRDLLAATRMITSMSAASTRIELEQNANTTRQYSCPRRGNGSVAGMLLHPPAAEKECRRALTYPRVMVLSAACSSLNHTTATRGRLIKVVGYFPAHKGCSRAAFSAAKDKALVEVAMMATASEARFGNALPLELCAETFCRESERH